MSNLRFHICFFRKKDEFFSFFNCVRNRLFNEDVLGSAKCHLSALKVRQSWCNNVYCINGIYQTLNGVKLFNSEFISSKFSLFMVGVEETNKFELRKSLDESSNEFCRDGLRLVHLFLTLIFQSLSNSNVLPHFRGN